MKTFLERLAAGETLVSDGAIGTNLQTLGLGLGVPPEEWVMDEPEKILALHRAFVDAGSDIILTCTFGGTRIRLRESKYLERTVELNQRAAQIACQAAQGRALVAGSMGPTGLLVEPLGELTHNQVADAYAEQAAALEQGGVDLLLLETFFALEEANAAIDGAKRASKLPLVVSFSYDQAGKTMMGLTPSQVARAMVPLGVAAIGANCGKSLEEMEKIVAELAALNLGVPLWIKPNAGLPRMDGDRSVYDLTPAMMGEAIARFVQMGARIVGGCCGNSPAHVAAIARAARQRD
ncbi:MAG: homocysteine S-methyltransferase family protein [Chloroflexi bacterium]|nr:homocysteine S-methyltransferase family protein [Chloroflexota bacterium]